MLLFISAVHFIWLDDFDGDGIGGLVYRRGIGESIRARVSCLGTGDEVLCRFAGSIGGERGDELAEGPDVDDVGCTYSVYFHDYNVLLNIT